MDNKDKVLFILTGPTAVGKTELSLKWASANNAEILSCDSLLFYQGMDIGTAKPSPEELERIPHHAIDIAASAKQYDIQSYLTLAEEIVKDIHSRNKQVLITGGSGFYLKCFFGPVIDNIHIPKDISQKVAEHHERNGLESLVSWLSELNPEGLDNLAIKNPRRVVRALERCLTTGKTIEQLLKEFKESEHPFKHYAKRSCLLFRDRENLKDRVRKRTQLMLNNGLIDEVKKLLEQNITDNPSAANSIGYRETIDFIKGEINKGELETSINQNTFRLIKKQLTWFRTQLTFDQQIDLDQNPDPLETIFKNV